MADLLFKANAIAEGLAVSSTETIVQVLAPSNHRVKLLGWSVSIDGTSVTVKPVRVELLRQTTAGTASSLSLVKCDDSLAESIQCTATQDFTAEPTAGDVLEVKYVHVQTSYEKLFPLGQEYKIGGGDRIGVRVITQSDLPASTNCNVELLCEE